MTGHCRDDICPACGSTEIQPYAVILGAAETYGYQCLTCAALWPVITPDDTPALVPARPKGNRG
jgi:hypothetical protein